jgi:hypothetical protein
MLSKIGQYNSLYLRWSAQLLRNLLIKDLASLLSRIIIQSSIAHH